MPVPTPLLTAAVALTVTTTALATLPLQGTQIDLTNGSNGRIQSAIDNAYTGAARPVGDVNADGYGVFRFDGQMGGAHRFAYRLLVGPIHEGMELDHLCRTRHCVNPAHMEVVTHAENVRRSARWSVA